jgi:hypothetical protein
MHMEEQQRHRDQKICIGRGKYKAMKQYDACSPAAPCGSMTSPREVQRELSLRVRKSAGMMGLDGGDNFRL